VSSFAVISIVVVLTFPSEALYQEQVEHFSNPDGTLRSMTYEEMKSLPLLDGVIRETLRLHSPIHTIMVCPFLFEPM
jgi:cytochrome P450